MIAKNLKFIFAFCMSLSTTLAYQERTLPTSLDSLTNLAQSLQLLASGSQNAGASNNVFQQFPFQLPQLPLQNLMAWLNSTAQTLNQGKPGQSNGGNNGPQVEPRRSFPPNPIYTTLPFNDLNLTEFSSLLENLQQVLKPDSDETQIDRDNETSGSNHILPVPKFFGNSGGNTTFGDLSFLTVPQLFNVLGRR
ncbi:unnamed protein product [Orchesella dallaii]|uniref:Uncharacterized protein n=1 Tax=Orchesella dallaii TaxID=48710 RepID=A0ABP1RG90_9HEXA